MACSKMVGFDVRPVTESSSIYRLSVPLSSKSRVMLSSHKLCPRSWSSLVAFIAPPHIHPDICLAARVALTPLATILLLKPRLRHPPGKEIRGGNS